MMESSILHLYHQKQKTEYNPIEILLKIQQFEDFCICQTHHTVFLTLLEECSALKSYLANFIPSIIQKYLQVKKSKK